MPYYITEFVPFSFDKFVSMKFYMAGDTGKKYHDNPDFELNMSLENLNSFYKDIESYLDSKRGIRNG